MSRNEQTSEIQVLQRCLAGESESYDANYLSKITRDAAACPREKLVMALASYTEAFLKFSETKIYSHFADVKTLSANLRKVEQDLSVTSKIGIAHEMISQMWGLVVKLACIQKP